MQKNKNKTKNKPKFMIPSSKRRGKSCELKIMPVIESYYSCIYSHFAYKINFVWIKWNRGVGMFYKDLALSYSSIIDLIFDKSRP